MKIKFNFFIIIAFTFIANAQIYTPNGTIQGVSGNDYVGIGTNTPLYKLNVYGSHSDARMVLHSVGGGDDSRQADLMLWASEPGLTYSGVGIGNNITNYTTSSLFLKLLNPLRGGSYLRLLDSALSLNVVSSSGNDTQALSINGEGNIGIGTSTANSKLEVIGNDSFNLEIAGFYNSRVYGSVNDKSEARINIGKLEGTIREPMGAIGAFPLNNTDSANGILAFYTRQNQSVIERIRINSNGNVGIGTTNADTKLTVNGNIHAKEVKIDLSIAAPDYVFANDYKLKTLKEVEEYIKENSHLPEIPSAKEIEKNGLMLAEMNMALLKKMEEMTLYMIEQNKRIEKLENKHKKFLKNN